MPRPPSTRSTVQGRSLRPTRSSARIPHNSSSSPVTAGANKSTSRQPRKSPPSRRNTITIKKALLPSNSTARSAASTAKASSGVDDSTDEIALESDELDLQSGPELSAAEDVEETHRPQYHPPSSAKKAATGKPAESIKDDDSVNVEDSDSSSDFTDGDDVGVPNFDDVINAPHPKTLLTSSGKLTARQRAMLTEPSASPTASYTESDLLFPPMKRVLTEEELLEKSELSRRRKHQREQALEERKVATIHRLLAKQGSRRNVGQKGRPPVAPKEATLDDDGTFMAQQEEAVEPEPKSRRKEYEEFLQRPLAPGTTRYHRTHSGAYLVTAAPLFPFGLGDSGAAAQGVKCTCCSNAKRYVHAETGQPLCADFACYRQIQ